MRVVFPDISPDGEGRAEEEGAETEAAEGNNSGGECWGALACIWGRGWGRDGEGQTIEAVLEFSARTEFGAHRLFCRKNSIEGKTQEIVCQNPARGFKTGECVDAVPGPSGFFLELVEGQC